MKRLSRLKEWYFNLSPTLNHKEQIENDITLVVCIGILVGIYFLYKYVPY